MQVRSTDANGLHAHLRQMLQASEPKLYGRGARWHGVGLFKETTPVFRTNDEAAGLKWKEALDARVQTRRAAVRGFHQLREEEVDAAHGIWSWRSMWS